MKKILYKAVLAVNIFFAVTLLISYLAVIISPGDLALPAFFGLAYPYLLVINIIFVIVWTMLLRYEAVISLVIIILGFNHFSNYIKLIRPSGDKTNTYKVLSYNVRLFNVFENNSGITSEKKIITFIKNQKPDVICLQEFFIEGNPALKESSIIQALGAKYYSHMKIIGSGRNRYYGIITLSRFPIIGKGEIKYQGSSSLSIYTDLLIQNDTVRLYNNHLQSFRLKRMEKSFIEELTGSDDKQKEVKSISSSLKKGFISRSLQAQILKDNINKSPFPVLVVGDFNDTPVSYAYTKIRKGLSDSFVNSGYGAGFTYKGNYPPNRIDYILYGNPFINSFFEILKLRYSDHYPIVAYFKKKT